MKLVERILTSHHIELVESPSQEIHRSGYSQVVGPAADASVTACITLSSADCTTDCASPKRDGGISPKAYGMNLRRNRRT